MIKFIKKLMVRLRKKEKNFIPTETHFGEIETNILSAFIVDDPEVDARIFSNFIFYQEADNSDLESITELKTMRTLINNTNCKSTMIQGDKGSILIISGSAADFDAVRKLYTNNFTYAWHKHLKNFLNYLLEYQVLPQDNESNTSDDLKNRLKYETSFPVEVQCCNAHDIHISDTSSKDWRYIINKYDSEKNILLHILPILAIYYNDANLGFEESSEEYVTHTIEPLTSFMYNYSCVFEKCITDTIDELYHMIPDEFRIDVLDKNIYELNLFSNPLDQSYLYDEIDEIID